MASTVQEISSRVKELAGIAGQAATQAEQMNGGVTKLTEAAKRIGDVIDVISTIAAQTNLLALNAAMVPGGADDKGGRRGQPTNIVDSVGDRGVGVSDQGNHRKRSIGSRRSRRQLPWPSKSRGLQPSKLPSMFNRPRRVLAQLPST